MTKHFEGMFAHPEDYVPYKLFIGGGALMCDWLTLLSGRFTDPFFSDTVQLCKFRAIEQKLALSNTSTLDTMVQAAEKLAPVSPAIIIFHLSRCGSTLVSQALASSPRFCVLSEVPFFDELLRHGDIRPEQRLELLPAALRFYGLKRYDAEDHVVIKTDCWHIFYYDIFRKLFPSALFVLMYRRPEEVLRSLLNRSGMQNIPQFIEPALFGLPDITESYRPGAYTASVIEKLLEKFVSVAEAGPNCLLLNYNAGILPAIESLLAAAGLGLKKEELFNITERIKYHSKQPDHVFVAEARAEIPSFIKPALTLYEKMEKQRIERGG